MRQFLNKIDVWIVLVLVMFSAIFVSACKKEKKCPENPTPVKPELWEKFIGTYKVYDTTGMYLYEMEIIHENYDFPNGGKGDSLHFINFDDNFNIGNQYVATTPEDYLPIGFHNPAYGINDSKTWQIYGHGGGNNNRLINDTLYLIFEKTNIQYYIQEQTPYYHCICKQIAVKQH